MITFGSPHGRLQLQIIGNEPVGEDDWLWLIYLSRKPNLVEERLAALRAGRTGGVKVLSRDEAAGGGP